MSNPMKTPKWQKLKIMGIVIVIIAIVVVVIIIIMINIQLPFKCYSKPAEVKQHGNHKLGSTQPTSVLVSFS